jgi:putative ABC transport system permease protein
VLTFRVIIGSILYRAIMYAGRRYGYVIHLTANDLKLITGALIIACLLVSKYGNGSLLKRKEASR